MDKTRIGATVGVFPGGLQSDSENASGMSWSSLWQQRHGSAATLLAFLPPVDLLSVLRVDRETQRRIRILIRKYQHDSARVGLALWLQRQAVLSFQAQYQVLTTRTIPRGAELDPRVPPRVVSTWTEQGTVEMMMMW